MFQLYCLSQSGVGGLQERHVALDVIGSIFRMVSWASVFQVSGLPGITIWSCLFCVFSITWSLLVPLNLQSL